MHETFLPISLFSNQRKSQMIPFKYPSATISCFLVTHQVFLIPFHLHLTSVCAEEPDVRTRKIVKVVTQTMINGKVVDESSEVEEIQETKK